MLIKARSPRLNTTLSATSSSARREVAATALVVDVDPLNLL